MWLPIPKGRRPPPTNLHLPPTPHLQPNHQPTRLPSLLRRRTPRPRPACILTNSHRRQPHLRRLLPFHPPPNTTTNLLRLPFPSERPRRMRKEESALLQERRRAMPRFLRLDFTRRWVREHERCENEYGVNTAGWAVWSNGVWAGAYVSQADLRDT